MELPTKLFNRLFVWNNPFRVDAPRTEKPGGSFAPAETELPQGEILSKDAGHFLTFFFRCFSHIFAIHLFLFISNYGQVFYKQLWSGLSSRNCLYFQIFFELKVA